jgi:CHAD domain-containing protein
VAGRRKSLLELQVGQAVARIAGNYLAAAAKGAARLENPEDPKALHAFRVAVRRLRSLLRLYEPWIGRAAGGKVSRGLRELTRSTNAARDLEVQQSWLAGRLEMLARSERAGAQWLARRLRDRGRRASRASSANVHEDLSRVAKRLRNRLEEAAGDDSASYKAAIAGLAQSEAAKLRARMALVAGADDTEGIHRARVQSKRLRYLVEPLRKDVPEARVAVRAMRKLQNLLGELHDRHVLEDMLAHYLEVAATEKAHRLHALAVAGDRGPLAREQRRDESQGLLALSARARGERDRLFAALERQWLGRGDELLSREIGGLVRVLARE